MKKIIAIFSFFLLFLAAKNVYAGKRITIEGVQYETISENTVSARFTIQAKGEITVLEFVSINKKNYSVVMLGKSFTKNNKVTAVILPQSLKTIKTGAFNGFPNMKRLVLPTGEYTIEQDAFVECDAVMNIEGNVSPFLEYKGKNGKVIKVESMKKPDIPKFSTYAEDKLKSRMKIWQTKKEYETAEQYKNRVTDDNRKKRMNEFVEDLKKEYTALYAPNNLSTSLVTYDSEYGVFTIQTVFYGKVFAKVSKDDAPVFQTNYNQVKVQPKFGVQADTLAIIDCKFLLDDKVFTSVASYGGTNETTYQFDLPPLDINLAAQNSKKPSFFSVDDAVDKNIPQTSQDNKYTFALIIGNEQYENESQVPFASNDAKIFAEYCKKTLGIPNENVQIYTNAGLNRIRYGVTSLVNTLKAYDGEAKAIVYYAGHGIPDESSHMPYLLPTDGFAKSIKTGFGLNELYDELASAPSQFTMVFLDACFSGVKRDGQMLAEARGVAIKARNTMPTGKLLVFSASQGDETAYSDKKHGHGMFTYYLLKHLQETKGDTSLGDLSNYVITNVKRNSVIENSGKIQTPTIIPSVDMMNAWQQVKLR